MFCPVRASHHCLKALSCECATAWSSVRNTSSAPLPPEERPLSFSLCSQALMRKAITTTFYKPKLDPADCLGCRLFGVQHQVGASVLPPTIQRGQHRQRSHRTM